MAMALVVVDMNVVGVVVFVGISPNVITMDSTNSENVVQEDVYLHAEPLSVSLNTTVIADIVYINLKKKKKIN
eukprot:Pgem_evm1s1642